MLSLPCSFEARNTFLSPRGIGRRWKGNEMLSTTSIYPATSSDSAYHPQHRNFQNSYRDLRCIFAFGMSATVPYHLAPGSESWGCIPIKLSQQYGLSKRHSILHVVHSTFSHFGTALALSDFPSVPFAVGCFLLRRSRRNDIRLNGYTEKILPSRHWLNLSHRDDLQPSESLLHSQDPNFLYRESVDARNLLTPTTRCNLMRAKHHEKSFDCSRSRPNPSLETLSHWVPAILDNAIIPLARIPPRYHSRLLEETPRHSIGRPGGQYRF